MISFSGTTTCYYSINNENTNIDKQEAKKIKVKSDKCMTFV